MRGRRVSILKRLLRLTVLGVVCLIALLLVAAVVVSMWGSREWRTVRAELAAKGEKLSMEEYRAERVGPGENFFDDALWNEGEPIPTVAADGSYGGYVPAPPWGGGGATFEEFDRKFTPEEVAAIKQKWPELAGVEFQGRRLYVLDSLRRDWRKKGDAWRAQAAGLIEETLKPGERLMERAVELLKRPEARAPVVFFDELYVRDVTGEKVYGLTEAFQVRSLAELERGERTEAAGDVVTLLKLSRVPWEGPTLRTSVAGMAALARALEVIDLGIARHGWTDADLRRFEEALKKVELLPLVMGAVRRHRATANGQVDVLMHGGVEKVFRRMRSLHERPREPGDSPFDRMPVWLEWGLGTLMKSYLAVLGRADQAKGNRLIQEVLEKVGTNGWRGLNAVLEPKNLANSPGGNSWLWSLTKYGQRWVEVNLRREANLQDMVVQARIAVALERYYLAKKEYPEKLEALVPEYLAEVPVEILTGEAMHYKRTEPGAFLLWADGWDGRDDRGRAAEFGKEDGDWVWGKG